jgi:predicted nucleotidyltransferase
MATLPSKVRASLNEAVEELLTRLGDNLYSCVLYGSAVRGDFVPVVSDVNLLIVLNKSNATAHAAIRNAVQGRLRIDPMVIGRPGMDRSFEAFALKFLSISQDHEVLHGIDPFEDFSVDPELDRFLCEQALRNVQLRLVRGYIVFGRDRLRYTDFLLHWIPTIFIDLSEVLRLTGTDVPHDFRDRIELLGQGFNIDTSVLTDLIDLKENPPRPSFDWRLIWGRRLSASEISRFHERVNILLTDAIQWMETRWPSSLYGASSITDQNKSKA